MPTKIEWASETLNPIREAGTAGSDTRWSCVQVSPGCCYCYASTLTVRRGGPAYPLPGQATEPPVTLEFHEPTLLKPLSWRQPRRIFVCSMTDLFAEWVPDEWIDRVLAVAALAHQHQFLLLTKRPERMRDYFRDPETRLRTSRQVVELLHPDDPFRAPHRTARKLHEQRVERARVRGVVPSELWPLPNVWCGVSIEQNSLVWRAAVLGETPAAVRFISAEPLLGALLSLSGQLERCEDDCPACRLFKDWSPNFGVNAGAAPGAAPPHRRRIRWVIGGGESGDARGPGGELLQRGRWMVEECAGRDCGHPDCDRHSHCLHHPQGSRWVTKDNALLAARALRDACAAAGVAFLWKQWGGPTSKSAGRFLDGRMHDDYPAALGTSPVREDPDFCRMCEGFGKVPAQPRGEPPDGTWDWCEYCKGSGVQPAREVLR
jgi:protein gp37